MNTDNPSLPDALKHLDDIRARLGARRLALFLDYDGTLAPIASTPDKAVLSPSMRAVLEHLAGHCQVAIISGRDRADVEAKVGIEGLIYAGAHGFDIAGGTLGEKVHSVGAEFAPALAEVRDRLHTALSGISGALIETKSTSIAVHYRLVPEAAGARVESGVREAMAGVAGLRLMAGKKVLEIQPAIDWHKGRAVLWLIETLGLDREAVLAVYIGDDVTDEDAFRALGERGIGIRVAGADALSGETAAAYGLDDTAAVERLLSAFAGIVA